MRDTGGWALLSVVGMMARDGVCRGRGGWSCRPWGRAGPDRLMPCSPGRRRRVDGMAPPEVDSWIVLASEPTDPPGSVRFRPEAADVADVTVVTDGAERLVSIVASSNQNGEGACAR